jgi:predicted permease
VQLWTVFPNSGRFPIVTGPQFKTWREHATVFAGLAIMQDRDARNLLAGSQAERIAGAQVSADFLGVLGLEPLLGRDFASDDDKLGGRNRVVLLTYEWWQSRFGGDRTVVGQMLNLGGLEHEVLGVLPPRALQQDEIQFLIPLVLDDFAWRMNPRTSWAIAIGRLAHGVTRAQAAGEVDAIARELATRNLPDTPYLGVQVLPLQQVSTERVRAPLVMLLAAVGLVLLIACANVANLLLARAASRTQEMAVRAALGASPRRMMRQVLMESLLLSLSGGVLGIWLANFCIDLLNRAVANVLPRMMHASLDWQVLAFTAALACGTGLLFGLVPALQACRTDVQRVLQRSGRSVSGGSPTRAQALLVISEIALTIVLLTGAGLLMRSFLRLQATDPGFRAHEAFVCDLSLAGQEFSTADEGRAGDLGPAQKRVVAFERELIAALGRLPGVTVVGSATTVPFGPMPWGAGVRRVDQSEADLRPSLLDYVGGDYFRAMGIPLLRGRTFAEAENVVDARPLVVISAGLAATLFPGADPLGQQIHFNDTDWEIIGVVGDVRHEHPESPAAGHIYAVHANNPWTISLVVRATAAPEFVLAQVQRTVAQLNSGQAVANFHTLGQVLSDSVQERRVTLMLFGIFAVVALALAALGLYGVIAYSVGLRTRELCIRMALGARPPGVVALVLRDGLRLAVPGMLIGLLGALAAARLVSGLLYEVSAADPVVFCVVIAMVAVVVAAAVVLPARRATRVDPIIALRAE